MRDRTPALPVLAVALVAALGAGVTAGACAAPLAARTLVQAAGERPAAVWFRNVNVFRAVEGEGVLRGQDVLVQGDRITSVSDTGRPTPPGARVVDGAGMTLVPGFVDAHVHLGFMGAAPWQPVEEDLAHNLSAHLYAGVTTVFDVGGDPAVTKRLRDDVERGALPGPRIYLTASPFTGPGSHPMSLGRDLVGFPLSLIVGLVVEQAATPAEARALVAKRVAQDLDYVKITYDDMPPGRPHMSERVLAAAIGAVHHAGLKAVVHTTAARDIARAAELGADMIAHGPYRDALSLEQAQVLAARGTPIVPTLAGFDGLADIVAGELTPHPLVRETTPASLLDPVVNEGAARLADYPALQALGAAAARGRSTWATSIENLMGAGAVVLVGTDSALPGTWPGGSYHHELALLAELGMPLDELLLGATSRAARFVEDDPAFGTIAPGKIADLVLLRGDPTTNVSALHAIEGVWRAGARVHRVPPDRTASAQ